MAGIVWGDERPRAATGNERPTLVGLEPVVLAAEPVQQLEQGVVADGADLSDAAIARNSGSHRATLTGRGT